MTPRPLLNAEQAAELLSVPVGWIRAETRAKRIPFVRLSERHARYDADQLEAWWLTRAEGPWRNRGQAADRAAALREVHLNAYHALGELTTLRRGGPHLTDGEFEALDAAIAYLTEILEQRKATEQAIAE